MYYLFFGATYSAFVAEVMKSYVFYVLYIHPYKSHTHTLTNTHMHPH
jgi:hypothetical protein